MVVWSLDNNFLCVSTCVICAARNTHFPCLLALLTFVGVHGSRVEGDFLLFLYVLNCPKQGDVKTCAFHKTGDVDSRNGKVIHCKGWGTSKVPSVHSGQTARVTGWSAPQRTALHVANYNLIGVSYTPV